MKNHFIIDALTVRDFDRINLLGSIVKLDYHFSTTSVACERTLYPPGIFIDNTLQNHKIRLKYLSPDELMQACTMGFGYPGLSLEDHSVLYLAHIENCALITSDPCITRAATLNGIMVCNYVWLLNTLAVAGIITDTEAWMKHLELVKNVSPIALSKMSDDFMAEAKTYKQKPA